MKFNVWTFLFQVINFLALVYILRRLLYRPLQEAIDQRRKLNAQAQADAEQARLLATSLQQQLTTRLAAIEKERQEVVNKAREQAEADRKSVMAAAERDANQRREKAAQQLEGERTQALQSLHAELVQSAVGLAERVLHEAAGSSLQRELAGRLVEAVQKTPEDERQRLGRELQADDAAVIETAADLNGEIAQGINGAIQSLVGRAVSVSVQTRPDLLAGLRLRLGGHVWDATLTGVLREVAPLSQAKP